MLAPPSVPLVAETEREFYRRKQSTVTIRHISGDRVVAMVEIVSPGSKATRSAVRAFIERAAELLGRRIHLLILDLFPPGPRDPGDLYGAIWEEVANQEYSPPAEKPLTLASYESGLTIRAYVVPVAVEDVLPEMPLFLEPGGRVLLPLETTYQAAWDLGGRPAPLASRARGWGMSDPGEAVRVEVGPRRWGSARPIPTGAG
ncbi:MAG: DUF4058 family protein [Isosphaeraceae bacterium]|nr:DUF4058 family protein [Isosphaeraceae bacterium]